MTIASTTSKVSYNGSGTVGPFPITFRFTKDADITATKRASTGTETVLTLTTDYTLTGAGDASGGSLTLTAALAVGESLVIARTPGIVQEVDYVENSAFPAETHEAALDLLTMICQSLQEQVDRAVKVEISSTTDPDDLLAELAADVVSAAASAATATTQAGLANTARIAAELAETNAEAAQAIVEGYSSGTTPWVAPDINGGTIDGATIGATSPGAGTFTTVTTNTIAERTAGSGVTVDSLLIKDGDLPGLPLVKCNDTVTDGALAVFSGTTGKLITDAPGGTFGDLVRALGGETYSVGLGVACAPSLEARSWESRATSNGAPTGWTFSRATTATAFGPDGLRYTADANELRHEWDESTGEYLGWLVEGAATNYLLNSGTPATQDVSLAAGTYVLWCEGTGSVALSGGPTGTASNASPVSFTLAGVTTVTFTVTGTLDLFQCEGGAAPSSYIPTTVAAATRAADVLTLATSEFPFKATEGTVLVEFARLSISNTDSPSIVSLDDGTADLQDTVQLYAVAGLAQAYLYCASGGATQAQFMAGVALAGVSTCAAIAYKANDFAACIDGGTVATDTSGTVPSLTRIVIGGGFFGHISNAVYFPRRIANTDLQALTK